MHLGPTRSPWNKAEDGGDGEERQTGLAGVGKAMRVEVARAEEPTPVMRKGQRVPQRPWNTDPQVAQLSFMNASSFSLPLEFSSLCALVLLRFWEILQRKPCLGVGVWPGS